MKILVIQQKMIGDVLTSSILLEALRSKYKKAELHYLINSHTYPVVEHNPFIDKFVFFTPEIEKSKSKFYQFLKEIKKEKYDVVIDVYSKISSNLITLFSGAKIKISKHKWYTSFLYTNTFKDEIKAKTNAGLVIENRLQLLSPIIDITKIYKPKIYLTDSEMVASKEFLVNNGIDLNNPLFMISVLGSGLNKTYPFEYMSKIIDTIIEEKPNAQILFNYIPKQENEARAIFNLCAKKTQKQIHFNVFGKSLREFLAITKYCTALIGNEGGAVNMAKALEIPTFTIFSPWIEKEIWNIFDNHTTHVSVHLSDYLKNDYKNIGNYKKLKKKALEMYHKFTPTLFKTKLKAFINQF